MEKLGSNLIIVTLMSHNSMIPNRIIITAVHAKVYCKQCAVGKCKDQVTKSFGHLNAMDHLQYSEACAPTFFGVIVTR